MTKKIKPFSLEDELPQSRKEKKPSKIAQFFLPKPKPVIDVSKIKLPRKPLNLLNKAPTTFNLGLTYIMLIGLGFVMILSGSVLIWGIGIPTIYAFYRHIKLERKRNRVDKGDKE